MKVISTVLLTLLLSAITGVRLLADTTISAATSNAYGANIGWINVAGDTTQGVVVRESCLSGYAYSANCGWISFGDVPANGHTYLNADATSFGVNHDGTGNLSGYAYGGNIGWINFGWAAPGNPQRPRFDLLTGAFSGYAYSANCGWISLGGGFLSTLSIRRPDADGDGIADAWEMKFFGNITTASATTDEDHDGTDDLAEYRAATVPTDSADYQRMHLQPLQAGGTLATLEFPSNPGRLYHITMSTNLATWVDSGLGVFLPNPGPSTLRTFTIPVSSRRFFRVAALLPLAP